MSEIKTGDKVTWSDKAPRDVKDRIGIGPFIVKDMMSLRKKNDVLCLE